MPGTELSHVRTELERRRIRTSVPPHPVQPNRHPATHRHFGNALVPSHRQVQVATPPVRVEARGCLCSLHQQVAQQGTALLADVPQPLLVPTGVFTRHHPYIRSDRLATSKPRRSSDDQHKGWPREPTLISQMLLVPLGSTASTSSVCLRSWPTLAVGS